MTTAPKNNTTVPDGSPSGSFDTLYVCTGINRLSGLREQCSIAAPKHVCEQFYEAWKKLRTRNKAFSHLRLEPYVPELSFNKKKKSCRSK